MFVDIPTRRRPRWIWATPLLVILAIAAYGWITWLPDDPAVRAAWQRWGTVTGSVAQWRLLVHDGRLLRLVTALFMHASWLHLLGNLAFLLMFGLPAERALGGLRFLFLFLIGGALANLAASLLMGAPGQIIIGASGGVSAVIGAYLVLFPHARLGIVVPLGLWLEFVRAPAALLIGLWAMLQLIFTFVGPSFGAVAWWAHLGGFLFGAISALLFRPAVARRARGY